MDKLRESGEKLVDAWLNLSSAIWNERIVTTMTFNETYVCNLLKHQLESDPNINLTATDLCVKTGLFKSQMNRILNSMEKSGYISRVRSDQDKRFVYIKLTERGLEVYEKGHEEIMTLVDNLILKIGNKKINETSGTVNKIANEFRKLMSEYKP